MSLEAAVGYLLLRNTWRLCSSLPYQSDASVPFLMLRAHSFVSFLSSVERGLVSFLVILSPDITFTFRNLRMTSK